MPKKSKLPELSESELRRLLLDRRQADRARRLRAFKHSGELLAASAAPAEPLEGDPLSGPKVHAAPSLKLEPGLRTSSWVDRILLAVEILAAVGLIYILFNGLSVLDTLNRELASALSLAPELSGPAPLIGPVVLPSGHTPPREGEPARPNENEIPAHLRPLMQAYVAAIEVPTPGPEQALGIEIETIGVSAPIVTGDDWEALKRGVGQHIGSADPGQNGNLVLTGHNDIYGEVFRYLEDLKPGDEIIIFTASRSYTYLVTETLIVEPDFIEVLEPTPNATLTLISCTPYRVDTQRIVVLAELQG
ncbi:MAG TPA: class D sortase [Anaerolineales bacterium]